MGRPEKKGIDYFPLEVGVLKKKKIRALMKKEGAEAFTVFIHVLSEAYEDEGYYVVCDEDFFELAAETTFLPEYRIRDIVGKMEEKGLIKRLETREGTILTSEGIQKQYTKIVSALRRKTTFTPDTEIWLLQINDDNDVCNNSQKEGLLQEKTMQKPTPGTQTKTNQKKQKETKENKTKTDDDPDVSDSFIPDFYDCVMANLKDFGVEIRKNTENIVSRWVRNYDQRSIIEAIELAANNKARNIVGYADTVLRKWELGDGSPRWVQEEESRYASEKEEYMKPGAFELKGVFA